MVRRGHAHHHHRGGHHHHRGGHHHHQGGITHHHGLAAHHHHHAARHHHGNVHRHPGVAATATPIGTFAQGSGPDPMPGRGYITCGAILCFFGFSILTSGCILLAIYRLSSSMGIVGICLIPVGSIMLLAFIVLCRKGRAAQLHSTTSFQQTAGVSTMMYGAQQPPPGGLAQPGVPPIVHPSPIVYGPTGEVSYYPGTLQTGIAPQLAGHMEPGTTHDAEDFVMIPDGRQVVPTAPVEPPPSYDDVISKGTPIDQ